MVFVIGLSPRLADPEVLKKNEYFGKYGRIYKVVINNHTVYNGAQVNMEVGREEGEEGGWMGGGGRKGRVFITSNRTCAGAQVYLEWWGEGKGGRRVGGRKRRAFIINNHTHTGAQVNLKGWGEGKVGGWKREG